MNTFHESPSQPLKKDNVGIDWHELYFSEMFHIILEIETVQNSGIELKVQASSA